MFEQNKSTGARTAHLCLDWFLQSKVYDFLLVEFFQGSSLLFDLITMIVIIVIMRMIVILQGTWHCTGLFVVIIHARERMAHCNYKLRLASIISFFMNVFICGHEIMMKQKRCFSLILCWLTYFFYHRALWVKHTWKYEKCPINKMSKK